MNTGGKTWLNDSIVKWLVVWDADMLFVFGGDGGAQNAVGCLG